MANRPVVLLDVDGVICDFLTPALAIANRIGGTNFKVNDIKTWNLFETIDPKYEKDCYAEWEKEGFCANLLPYLDAQDGVKRLRSIADVHILTTATHSRHWYYERVEWLGNYFDIPRKMVHFTAHKERFRGDVIIDDRPSHVAGWTYAHKGNDSDRDRGGTGLLWDRPYNRTLTSHEQLWCFRVTNWDGALQIISHL